MSNLCNRCGKERVVARTWKEKVANSVVTYMITVCPDSDCQKQVDRENAKDKERRDAVAQQRLLHFQGQNRRHQSVRLHGTNS